MKVYHSLSLLYFCLSLHDILISLQPSFKITYLDDVGLLGNSSSVLNDATSFTFSGNEVGLKLSSDRCELTFFNEKNEDHSCVFRETLLGLEIVSCSDTVFLGSAMEESSLLNEFIATTRKFHDRLLMIPAYDTLVLLRNCFAIPKLLQCSIP